MKKENNPKETDNGPSSSGIKRTNPERSGPQGNEF